MRGVRVPEGTFKRQSILNRFLWTLPLKPNNYSEKTPVGEISQSFWRMGAQPWLKSHSPSSIDNSAFNGDLTFVCKAIGYGQRSGKMNGQSPGTGGGESSPSNGCLIFVNQLENPPLIKRGVSTRYLATGGYFYKTWFSDVKGIFMPLCQRTIWSTICERIFVKIMHACTYFMMVAANKHFMIL